MTCTRIWIYNKHENSNYGIFEQGGAKKRMCRRFCLRHIRWKLVTDGHLHQPNACCGPGILVVYPGFVGKTLTLLLLRGCDPQCVEWLNGHRTTDSCTAASLWRYQPRLPLRISAPAGVGTGRDKSLANFLLINLTPFRPQKDGTIIGKIFPKVKRAARWR